MRELVPLAFLALACGAVLREPLGCAREPAPTKLPIGVVIAKEAGSEASFSALAALGARIAPGMREVARVQSAGDKVEITHAEGHDTCLRVAFTSSLPVVGKLVDDEGKELASSGTPTTEGVLGPQGPVCVRKGDAVSTVAEGADASILWVGWESP